MASRSWHSASSRFPKFLNLRPMVSRPVCLGVRLPSGAHDQSFVFCLMIAGFLMWSTLWLEDGSVIYLYNCFWALPEQSLSGPSPAELTTIIYCLSWDSPPLGGPGPRIYIPQEQGGPVIPLGTGFPFVASYNSQGYGGGILTRLHMECNSYPYNLLTWTTRKHYSSFLPLFS
jgi:hypothetical protein